MGFALKLFRGKGYTTVSGSQLKEILNNSNVLILDVRNQNEYGRGHIPNAVNIPLDELPRKLSQINSYKNDEIVVYCAFGGRSLKAADILSKNGFKKIYNLSGGISSYKGKLSRI
ncbi:rhodanese-like domain-containing protein [Terrisporobacter sp.]